MKFALLAALALFCVPAAAQPVNHALPSWMAGAWEKTDGEKWADEFWTPPRAGIMIGASRSGDGAKLGFWEHMRIMREADGALAFGRLPETSQRCVLPQPNRARMKLSLKMRSMIIRNASVIGGTERP